MSIGIGFAGIAALCVLLSIRVPLAVALITVSFVGIGMMIGWHPALGTIATTPYSFTASWTLSAIPMFLLMGYISYYSGITNSLFDAARSLLRWMPGSLGIACILACTGFATACGSSIASAAAMGRIAIPNMVRGGYNPGFACGCVAAGGTIGALIPPSILMIIYCVFTETPVTPVFLGGVSVGLLTAIGYIAVILLVSWLRPDIVPSRAQTDDVVPAGRAILSVWPVVLLAAVVFVGLFGGLFTATEAGAAGAFGAIMIALVTRKLSRAAFWDSLRETLVTCASLFVIGVGAVMFTRFLSLSGVTGFMAAAFGGAEMSYSETMLIIVLIYLALGMFMEPFGAMLVTLPILMPVLQAQGVSTIWFGVIVVKLLEIGMVTPPVGMNVFVIRQVASEFASLAQIFAGVMLFVISDLIILFIAIAFPGIVLYLPGLM